MKFGNSTSSYLTDALGSVRGVASSTGALSLGYSYTPYGKTGPTTTGKNAPENPLQFIGAPLNAPLYRMGPPTAGSSPPTRRVSPDAARPAAAWTKPPTESWTCRAGYWRCPGQPITASAAEHLNVPPGTYLVLVEYLNLGSIADDAIEGDER